MNGNEVPRICYDRVLPPELALVAAGMAVDENPTNRPVFHFSPGLGVPPMPPTELAALTAKKWPNGRTLHVRFLDGDPQVQARLQPFAHQWSEFANITFVFDNSPDAEIRISFEHQGSWSYLGTDALAIASDEPTMNYGWLTNNTPDDEYSRVVIHEFGHALGCFHEHQNPIAGIPWDKEAVYAHYAGPPNFWTKAQTDHNLFTRYSQSISQFSEFDPDSIMLYSIPDSMTIGSFQVGWNRVLSPTDTSFVNVLYPKAEKDLVELTVNARSKKADIGKHAEEDLFRFRAQQDGVYQVETNGWTDVIMTLSGPEDDSLQIAEDDDSGMFRNARISAQIGAGDYYIRVRHYRPRGTGQYWIRVKRVT
jgi:hypothetical protein